MKKINAAFTVLACFALMFPGGSALHSRPIVSPAPISTPAAQAEENPTTCRTSSVSTERPDPVTSEGPCNAYPAPGQ